MGIVLRIGEQAAITSDDELVANFSRPDARTFGDDDTLIDWQKNTLWMDYGTWGRFCRRTGLRSLFHDEEVGLLRNDPGYVVLEQGHYDILAAALARWQKAHPNATPGLNSGQDRILAYLLWFESWMAWALEGCAQGAIALE
ncbi:hypothetical protein LZC95_50100 [Pendulispora brunnea]|uniref:Uncharacterized protein n=1 Tax=Pendulispora brunnea TaxID=2905690 RepID=A0ABZ2K7B5_9BACT